MIVVGRGFHPRVVVRGNFSVSNDRCSVREVRHSRVRAMFGRVEFVLAGSGSGHCRLIVCSGARDGDVTD